MATIFKDNDKFNRFYKSWMMKLKDLEQREAYEFDLEQRKAYEFSYVYDKFFTLYVIYNFLYAIVAREQEEAREYDDKEEVKDDIKLCRNFQDEIDEITNLLTTGSSYVIDDEEKNREIINKLEFLKDIAKKYEKVKNENKKMREYEDKKAATKGIKKFLGLRTFVGSFNVKLMKLQTC